MFSRTAHLYDLIYSGVVDYAARADEIDETVRRRTPSARSLLEVGCGPGRYLELLRDRGYEDVAGIDLDPGMVAVCAERLPGVPVTLADMAGFELGRRFDAVICPFSSIGYVRTLQRMRSAVASMARHLASGGVLLFDGWIERGHWQPGLLTVHSGRDESTSVARMMRSDVIADDPTLSVMDMHYLIGTAAGVEYVTERHELGLFTRAEYVEACVDAGLREVRAYDSPMGGRRSRIVAGAPESA